MPKQGRRARIPDEKIPDDLPISLSDHVAEQAAVGYEKVSFGHMNVEDAFEDTEIIRYSWPIDEMTDREHRDAIEMIKKEHDGYDVVRYGKTDTEYVVRLDYTG